MQTESNRLPLALLMVLSLALVATQLLLIGERHVALASAADARRLTQNYSDDPRLAKAYRFDRGGWIYVHLEGAPYDIGYQHGYLLAPEIADAFAAVSLEMTHATGRDWDFFRRAAHDMLWHRIDPEYQAERHGIVGGLEAQKVKLDLDDIVAMNAFMELPDYYVPWLNSVTRA